MRRKSKRDRNRTQTVMMTAPTATTTMESAGAIAKNGYPAMPVTTTQPTRAAGKNPTVTAEDVNKAAPMAAAALVIVHHQHHKRSGYQAVCLWMLRKQLDLIILTGH